MAILQRTLASGSIWIGTSSSVQDWSGYNSAHHNPFAIVRDAYNALNFNTENPTNILYLNTTSIRSANYVAGFDPTNQGNRGFAIDLINNRYVAEFDDLWVRGRMNVHEFVINQIRATNGSLWVSDAAKAISASSASAGLILSFESGSALPFVQGDIIRSKRWIVTQTQISNWDVITVVDSIDYANYNLTGSLAGITYWTASAQSLGNLTQSAGSDWVRIGHTSSTSRQGGIYLTAGDNQSPYIDIYDSVSTVAGGHQGDSASIKSNHLKARLGRLQGLNTTEFGSLSGYGLYSENVYLKGTISATAGTFSAYLQSPLGLIGGWTIGSDKLYSGNVTLSSVSGNSYLGIGSSAYQNTGIYIGSSSTSGNRLSLVQGTNKFLWDGNNLGITTSNFTLSGGNITAKGGSIANWSIAQKSLSSVNTNTSINIRTETSSNWNIVSKSGVTYTSMINHPNLFGKIGEWFTSSIPQFDTYLGSTESSYSGTPHIIKFTSSMATSAQFFAKHKNSISISEKTTAFFAFKHIQVDSSLVISEYRQTIQLYLTTETETKSSVVLFGPEYASSKENYYFSYTNDSLTTEELYFKLYLKNTTPVGKSLTFGITCSNFMMVTSSGYTQLNPHGLLVWAGPSNYIKFTTDDKQQYAVASFDQLYVGGESIKGGASSGEGGSGGIDGGGTTGYIPIWTDANTIGDSHISQSGTTIGTNYTISAPVFTGSGFSLTPGYTNSITMGYYPAGSQLGGKNLLQVIDNAFRFAVPTIERSSAGTWQTPSGSTTLFVIPATSSVASVTWNTQFELPAKFNAVSIGFSYSGFAWNYNNSNNFQVTASDTANYMTYSYGFSSAGSPTVTNVSPSTVLYYGRQTNITSYVGFTFTASYTGSITTVPALSLAPKFDITVGTGNGTLKDILGNAVTQTNMSDVTSTTYATLARYGYRFFIAKPDGETTVFQPCTLTAGSTVIVAPKSATTWTSYQDAFTASIALLDTSTTYFTSKGLTLKKELFNEASAITPVSVFLLAPSATIIWNTAVEAGARWSGWDCKKCSSNQVTGIGYQNTITPQLLVSSKKLTNIGSVAGDPQLALNTVDGAYTKSWINSLTSTTKLFLILTLDATQPSDLTKTWT